MAADNDTFRAARDKLVRSAAPYAPVLCLYVIWDGSQPVKVGFSQDVRKRLSQLQTSHARRLAIYVQEPVETLDIRDAEDAAHIMLKRHRVRGEWFDCHPETALAAVRRVAWLAENGPDPDF